MKIRALIKPDSICQRDAPRARCIAPRIKLHDNVSGISGRTARTVDWMRSSETRTTASPCSIGGSCRCRLSQRAFAFEIEMSRGIKGPPRFGTGAKHPFSCVARTGKIQKKIVAAIGRKRGRIGCEYVESFSTICALLRSAQKELVEILAGWICEDASRCRGVQKR